MIAFLHMQMVLYFIHSEIGKINYNLLAEHHCQDRLFVSSDGAGIQSHQPLLRCSCSAHGSQHACV